MRRPHYRPAFLAVPVAALAAAAALLVVVDGTGSNPAAGTTTTTATAAKNPAPQEQALQTSFVETVKAVSPSVVEVQTPVGLGSGVVLDGNGNVVTNNHVVGSYSHFNVTDATGKRYAATLVGTFPPDDLAVIHVAGAHLTPLEFGNSSRLQVGDIVLAVGNPLGLQSSVTQGVVSALGRTVSEQNGTALPDVIQTSAAINPGNSGGALVDLDGRVVGIPTLAAIDSETSQLANGIGFAIPSTTVKAIASQLVRYGHVVNSDRAYIGVRLATAASGGVVVLSVVPNGPAASAGIVARDMIIAIDGHTVRSIDDVAVALANIRPGAKATFTVGTTTGKTDTIAVTPGQYPGS
jgi:S1-C subfamily serine protease